MSELTGLTPESVQSEIKRTRHKAEHPLYAISIILGIAAVLVVFFYGFKEHGILDMIKDTLAKENITDVSPEFNTIVIFCSQTVRSTHSPAGLPENTMCRSMPRYSKSVIWNTKTWIP